LLLSYFPGCHYLAVIAFRLFASHCYDAAAAGAFPPMFSPFTLPDVVTCCCFRLITPGFRRRFALRFRRFRFRSFDFATYASLLIIAIFRFHALATIFHFA